MVAGIGRIEQQIRNKAPGGQARKFKMDACLTAVENFVSA